MSGKQPVTEKLHPNQQQLDVHEPEKDELTADDFKKLRAKKEVKKEEVELDESIKTTHENPLVTVHDKNGLHTHANLSVANDIFGTNVKHSDVHKGEVKTKSRAGDVRFNISKHHEKAMKEEVEQLDEIGNTPAGQAALKAVSARGDKEMSDWNKKPESGYSSAPKKVVKHSAGGMNADRRLSGQGISKGKEGQAQRQIDYTNKMRGEEVEAIDEVKLADLPSRKIQGRAYGASRPEPHAVDTIKGPNDAELKKIEAEKKKKKFSEMVNLYQDKGLKSLSEMLAKEEATEDEFNKELDDVKEKNAGKKKNDEIAKGAVQSVKNEETHTTVEVIDLNDVNGVQYSEIELAQERTLTEPEMKKKEEIVKSMKKGLSGFKDRYGDRAKEVMYATATKQAMKD